MAYAPCNALLPTPGAFGEETGVEKVSTRHVENVRHVNSQAKVKPAESCPPERRRDWTRRWNLNPKRPTGGVGSGPGGPPTSTNLCGVCCDENFPHSADYMER